MSNRVEDLERQVAELQAAVNGLTEELVEMKERVRQVEDAQEVSVTADAAEESAPDESTSEASEAAGGERRTHSDDHVEVVERADEGPASGTGAAAGNDSSSDEEAATPDAESADESDGEGEESDSDIIVA